MTALVLIHDCTLTNKWLRSTNKWLWNKCFNLVSNMTTTELRCDKERLQIDHDGIRLSFFPSLAWLNTKGCRLHLRNLWLLLKIDIFLQNDHSSYACMAKIWHPKLITTSGIYSRSHSIKDINWNIRGLSTPYGEHWPMSLGFCSRSSGCTVERPLEPYTCECTTLALLKGHLCHCRLMRTLASLPLHFLFLVHGRMLPSIPTTLPTVFYLV